MVYGHRRDLERAGLRGPMGPVGLIGLMSPPISPIRSQRPARPDLPTRPYVRCALLAPGRAGARPTVGFLFFRLRSGKTGETQSLAGEHDHPGL